MLEERRLILLAAAVLVAALAQLGYGRVDTLFTEQGGE
jgi:hypothetical protein